MIKKLSLPLLLGVVLILSSCESTGICTEPVTPKLRIGFSDVDHLGNTISVIPPEELKIYGNRDGKDIIGSSPENEFIYPNMSPADEDKLVSLIFDVNRDSLKYIYKFKGDIYDTLELKYIRQNIYINNDCGYKTTFSEVELKYYSTIAIDTIILLTENIEYDTEQHIQIFTK
ncbi:MAG: hypothetical protein KAG37_04370 [Flavobacteriales bacterium]|nr:hypothetical protein [Flavobacteriales bacterium]